MTSKPTLVLFVAQGATCYGMLWYDGYEVAYIIRRRINKDTAACEMHDSLYNRMVFTIL
jgi:hypothetical protein